MVGGCSTASGTGHGMMGNAGGTQPGMMGGFGGGMMGDAPLGYHLSRLSCEAPSSLPGTTVYVMVGDMGMTHMMGGVAPLGGHMMLRAIPAEVTAGEISFVVGNMGWRTHELVVLPLGPASGPDSASLARTVRSTSRTASVKHPQPVRPDPVKESRPEPSAGSR